MFTVRLISRKYYIIYLKNELMMSKVHGPKVVTAHTPNVASFHFTLFTAHFVVLEAEIMQNRQEKCLILQLLYVTEAAFKCCTIYYRGEQGHNEVAKRLVSKRCSSSLR